MIKGSKYSKVFWIVLLIIIIIVCLLLCIFCFSNYRRTEDKQINRNISPSKRSGTIKDLSQELSNTSLEVTNIKDRSEPKNVELKSMVQQQIGKQFTNETYLNIATNNLQQFIDTYDLQINFDLPIYFADANQEGIAHTIDFICTTKQGDTVSLLFNIDDQGNLLGATLY